MSLSIIDVLQHIRDELIFLNEDSKNYTFESFSKDKKTILSYCRSLEIIGEACKYVSENNRLSYPQIDWKGFAGLRDIIIHQYFGLDYEVIWDVVSKEVPEVRKEIEQILKSEGY